MVYDRIIIVELPIEYYSRLLYINTADSILFNRKYLVYIGQSIDYAGRLSGRWQAPAAVLPEGPKDQVESHSRARRAREWLKPASPRARRARGRAKLSRRLPVLLYVFHDSAKNRDFHGTI